MLKKNLEDMKRQNVPISGGMFSSKEFPFVPIAMYSKHLLMGLNLCVAKYDDHINP